MRNKEHSVEGLPIGMGHGVAGRFGGLPDSFSGKDSAIVLLPVPFDKTTTYQKGSDLGPEALIEASRNLELYDIETDYEVFELGIHTAEAIQQPFSEEMLAKVHQQVFKFLKKKQFVVTVGGEHSISPAAVKAHAEHYPGMSVLQLDAHADLQPAYEGNPLSHASAMFRVREIPSVSNLVAVGIRSMSAEEKQYQDKGSTFFAHDISLGEEWIKDVVSKLNKNVYITFDLDVFDPSIMPSTGTPEPGGLSWYPIMALIKRVAKEKNIVGFDVVELCPNPTNRSPDFLAAKLIYKMLSYIFAPSLKIGKTE